MKSLKIITLAALLCLSTGCLTKQCRHDYFPVEPEWAEFSRIPIISKHGNDYVVSDEFLELATQQKFFVERVIKWRDTNNIP